MNKSILIAFITLMSVSCTDTNYSPIPDTSVYLELNLISAPYNQLKTSPLSVFTFKKGITITDRVGYGGILVTTGFDGTVYAFDMACPYEIKGDIRVYPPSDGNFAGQVICEKCGSSFQVGYGVGNPVKGPAKKPLRRYKASNYGNYLIITRQN